MARLARILALAIISALGLVFVSTSSAQAITCITETFSTFKEKRCKDFDTSRVGAKVTRTYSSYTFDDRAGNDSITANMRITDSKADGECAYIRVDKHHEDATYLDSKQIVGTACGKGEYDDVGIVAIGNQMPNHGYIEIRVCVSKKVCSRFWRQNI